jgi:hypothetical protein
MKNSSLTFDDLQYHLYQAKGEDEQPTLDVTLYTVNRNSGELTVIEPGKAFYVANPKPGHMCLIRMYNSSKYFNIPMFYVHKNSRDDSWMTGFIASNHILFLNKDDAKKLSMNILRKKKRELEAKMNRVKNL